LPQLKKDSDIDFASEVESAASVAYAKKTSIGHDDLRNEYHVALDIMKKTGKPPITLDQNCLTCSGNARETDSILKLFKTACLSYAPTNVTYRKHTISRTALIGMRRELIDKISDLLEKSDLFTKQSSFPRRYFDDMMIDNALNTQ
jgi:hypothetical protein